MITMSKALKMGNGILVAVPNRMEEGSDGQRFTNAIESATETALREIAEKGIVGRDITPYILERVHKLTDGVSLTANIRLIHNNAAIGAQIAKRLHSERHKVRRVGNREGARSKSDVLVVGGCVSDVIGSPHSASTGLVARSSNPGHTVSLFGGTGRNITECIQRLGHSVTMLSAVGDDERGREMVRYLEGLGVNMDEIAVSRQHPTSSYLAIYNTENDLFISIADLTALEHEMSDSYFDRPNVAKLIEEASFLVLDGNLTLKMMKKVLSKVKNRDSVRIWYEPISVEKCRRIVDHENGRRLIGGVDFISPNEMELISLLEATGYPDAIKESPSLSQWAGYCRFVIGRGVQNVILSMGSNGVLVVMGNGRSEHIKVDKLTPNEIVNTNGAGDNLCGATICGLVEGLDLVEAVRRGIGASRLCLQSKYAVHPDLTKDVLAERGTAKIRSSL